VSRWNAGVGPEDEVWHLGDFARSTTGQVEELLGTLNGHKHLIIGNNDPERALIAQG
jgi:calcineurin-like phosphoesterase family protein